MKTTNPIILALTAFVLLSGASYAFAKTPKSVAADLGSLAGQAKRCGIDNEEFIMYSAYKLADLAEESSVPLVDIQIEFITSIVAAEKGVSQGAACQAVQESYARTLESLKKDQQ